MSLCEKHLNPVDDFFSFFHFHFYHFCHHPSFFYVSSFSFSFSFYLECLPVGHFLCSDNL